MGHCQTKGAGPDPHPAARNIDLPRSWTPDDRGRGKGAQPVLLGAFPASIATQLLTPSESVASLRTRLTAENYAPHDFSFGGEQIRRVDPCGRAVQREGLQHRQPQRGADSRSDGFADD